MSRWSPSPILEHSSTLDLALRKAIDQCIMCPCHEHRSAVNSCLGDSLPNALVTHLFDALENVSSDAYDGTPAMLGSYLASRMILTGVRLRSALVECMYILVDAVRRLDAIDIVRWRFILENQADYANSAVALRIVRQSIGYTALLSDLSNDVELEWELNILKTA